MTYDEIRRRLREAGYTCDESLLSHEATLLLSHFCGIPPARVPLERHTDFSLPALAEAVARRAEGYPLQYLLGEWGFWEQVYTVNEACLVPREDTELLVKTAIERLPRGAYFADLCTGSGCVAISTLASRPDCRALAVDLFEQTLAVARENAVRNGVAERVTFARDDVCRPERTAEAACYDAILSNPPYVPTAEVEALTGAVRYEPRAALDGGADGFAFYRAILTQYRASLKAGGQFFFEIGYDQGAGMRVLAASHGLSCTILRDLSGQDRVALLSYEA